MTHQTKRAVGTDAPRCNAIDLTGTAQAVLDAGQAVPNTERAESSAPSRTGPGDTAADAEVIGPPAGVQNVDASVPERARGELVGGHRPPKWATEPVAVGKHHAGDTQQIADGGNEAISAIGKPLRRGQRVPGLPSTCPSSSSERTNAAARGALAHSCRLVAAAGRIVRAGPVTTTDQSWSSSSEAWRAAMAIRS